MDSSKLLGWLQFGGTIGVLIGLVLVGAQIYQTTELTKLQMENDWRTGLIERSFIMMGESPADALARAIDDPDSLTTSDFIVLHSYLSSYIEYWNRAKAFSDVGLFHEKRWRQHFDSDGQPLIQYFGNEFGKAYWASIEEKYGGRWTRNEEFDSALGLAIGKVDSSDMDEWHALIRSKIGQ